jgi:hypothetical protein
MYRRRVTDKRTVLGYGSYPPNENFWPMLSKYPAPETLDLLQWWDVKYVIVDESLYRSGQSFGACATPGRRLNRPSGAAAPGGARGF